MRPYHMYRPNSAPIAYSSCAALYCPDCAERLELTTPGAMDRDGNPVGVVAPWEECNDFCDCCFSPLS